MNIGKTLFAQLMDYLPWSTFDGSSRAMMATAVRNVALFAMQNSRNTHQHNLT